MQDISTDLSNCDREPIHIPGHIQSHGFMIAVDEHFLIRFYSENIFHFIPNLPSQLLGNEVQLLEPFIKDATSGDFSFSQLILFGKNNHFEKINPYRVIIADVQYYCIIGVSANCFLLEFEPVSTEDDDNIQGLIGGAVSEMLGDKNLQNLLNNTAREVKKIIGFDRVMVYRFADDGHGEVVAEAKTDELETWMGLHFPASDIPKQARELYKLNLTRLIADVDTASIKIRSEAADAILDLTNSQLRAVSPIHIQYLKNMGVASSFSISLIYKRELWGLIACHNYTPQFISYKSRNSAKLIGQILSSALEYQQNQEIQQAQEVFSRILASLGKFMNAYDNIDEAITRDNQLNLLNVVEATGVRISFEGRATSLGITPQQEMIIELIQLIKKRTDQTVYYTDSLVSKWPQFASYKDIASGVMVCFLSRELNEYIIWFRPAKIKTINWAGNPEKGIEIKEDGIAHLSPRNSFKVWSQTVDGYADGWRLDEIKSVKRLKEEIAYAINEKAGTLRTLNEKLRQAYEELDTFSYTISHDLKNPLSIIKGFTQLLQMEQGLSERGLGFLQRINERTDKMNTMIQEILEYSRIGRTDLQEQQIPMNVVITEIVNDMKHIYSSVDFNIHLGDMPDLLGDKVMLQQVFANLISNAMKYSQHAANAYVSISGEENDDQICYTITDNGVGIAEKDLLGVFELFTRMQNVGHIEGSGVGLSIVKRIVDKHKGRIWVESKIGEGSKFFVCFKKGVQIT